MARALADILTELNSVYNPQRQAQTDIYNKGIESVAPQETADLSGLEVAKQNAFESINTGANRRGMYFSGIPLAEQGKYVGENYLPSIAGLKNRYAGIRGNLYQTLAQQLGELDTRQREFGQGIYNQEVQQDIERERIAEAARQAELDRQAAARASASSGGSGGISFGSTGTSNTANKTGGLDINSLYSTLATQYKNNPTATRQQQDNWVRAWMLQNGADPNAADDPYGVWSAYNNKYPWEKYSVAAPITSTAVPAGATVLGTGKTTFTGSGGGGW